MRGNPTSPTGQTAALAAPKNAMGYTVTEAAKILGKHPNTIYAWTRPGCPLADARQIGSTFYIPRRAVRALLDLDDDTAELANATGGDAA